MIADWKVEQQWVSDEWPDEHAKHWAILKDERRRTCIEDMPMPVYESDLSKGREYFEELGLHTHPSANDIFFK